MNSAKSTVSVNDTLKSIQEVNLSYLVLAQRLIAEDPDMGAYRLGLTAETAKLLANLSLSQTVKLSAMPGLLCAFRMNDAMLLCALAENGTRVGPCVTHSAILLAPHRVDALAA